ncbi:Spy/CpxP family protein refolding chaperone [Marinobacter sp. JSM 1782161]|uniref:Spy/CpxP family protein refolding chaperone n=1 Tax=Marinobacter sp. JSM 1782161 TaxID=2685906 RepID=UPI001403D792|nr:Spy/CpxP family protein refolding chaperone [Marinobacter sp. JSM 1782161]
MKAMKSSRLMIPAMLAAAMVASPLAFSGEHRGHDDRPPMHHDGKGPRGGLQQRLDFLSDKLDLSAEQRDQLRDLFDEAHVARMEQFKAMRDGEKPDLMSGDPDSSDYKDAVAEAANKAAEFARQRIESRAEQYRAIYNILNDDQREIWAELQAERKKHSPRDAGPRRGGPGQGPDCGPGPRPPEPPQDDA